jgi:(S)-ureidoglycine-glyoxylate aminotransferase
MDYWSDQALNHHTEATTMLYAARECARVCLKETLPSAFARHVLASRALREGLQAIGLELFGDPRHRMANVTGILIPQGIDGERVRSMLLERHNIEIGTSFGPLHGRIWRIGTMGYNARPDPVYETLNALEEVLLQQNFGLPRGEGVRAARAVYGRKS